MGEVVETVLGPDQGPILWWQMALRTVLIFAYLIVLIRLSRMRAFARISAFDLAVGLVLGSLLSRAITANAPFVPALVAAAVLMGLHRGLSVAAWHWPSFGRFVKGRSVCLVEDGELLRSAMRRTDVTEHDLMEALRIHSHTDDLSRVKGAYFERNGEISFLMRE